VDTHDVFQSVVLEEYLQKDSSDCLPASIQVDLRGHEMAGCFHVGNCIEVTGTTRTRRRVEKDAASGQEKKMVFLEALHCRTLMPLQRPLPNKFAVMLALLEHTPHALALVVNSLAPTVVGNQLLKLSLLLALVGGANSNADALIGTAARTQLQPTDHGSIHLALVSSRKRWLKELLNSVALLSPNGQKVEINQTHTQSVRVDKHIIHKQRHFVFTATSPVVLRQQGHLCVKRGWTLDTEKFREAHSVCVLTLPLLLVTCCSE